MSITELKDKLRALDEARENIDAATDDAEEWDAKEDAEAAITDLIDAARRVAEQAGEPVADIGNDQNWRRMDGATAYHLIDRHADNWNEIGLMMDAWRLANTPPSADELVEAVSRYFDAKEEYRRADSDRHGLICAGTAAGKLFNAERALRTAIAKHKENSR